MKYTSDEQARRVDVQQGQQAEDEHQVAGRRRDVPQDLPADGPTRVWLSAWMSRLAERMALAPRITKATVRPMTRYRYMSCRWTPPRFMPAISAAIARTPVIMLRAKVRPPYWWRATLGGRTRLNGLRQSFTHLPCSLAHMPLPLRASADRSLAVLPGASRLRCSLAHGLFYGIAVSGKRGGGSSRVATVVGRLAEVASPGASG